jgi:hypothetical protein
MKNRAKTDLYHSRRIYYEPETLRELHEPVREIGEIFIDRACFKKSRAEKELLKALRLDVKRDKLKRKLLL